MRVWGLAIVAVVAAAAVVYVVFVDRKEHAKW